MNMKVYKKVTVIAAAMLAVFSWDVYSADRSFDSKLASTVIPELNLKEMEPPKEEEEEDKSKSKDSKKTEPESNPSPSPKEEDKEEKNPDLDLKPKLEISRTEESKMKAGEESLEGQLKNYFASEDGKDAIGTVLKEQLTSYFGRGDGKNAIKGIVETVLEAQLKIYFGSKKESIGKSLEEQLGIYLSGDGKIAIKNLMKECFFGGSLLGSGVVAEDTSFYSTLVQNTSESTSKKLKPSISGFWTILFSNFTSMAVILFTFKKFGLI